MIKLRNELEWNGNGIGMPQGKLVSSPSSNIPIGFLLFLGLLWDSYRKRGGSVKTSK